MRSSVSVSISSTCANIFGPASDQLRQAARRKLSWFPAPSPRSCAPECHPPGQCSRSTTHLNVVHSPCADHLRTASSYINPWQPRRPRKQCISRRSQVPAQSLPPINSPPSSRSHRTWSPSSYPPRSKAPKAFKCSHTIHNPSAPTSAGLSVSTGKPRANPRPNEQWLHLKIEPNIPAATLSPAAAQPTRLQLPWTACRLEASWRKQVP